MFKESSERKIGSEDLHEKHESRARKIAHFGNFDLVREKLRQENLLESEKERVSKHFTSAIESSDFPTKDQKLWEMLTILELYDPETAIHSIKTYQIAKEKIEKVLSKNVVLSRIIEAEGVDLERFYFACLSHDIGKIEIPHFIIQNKITKAQWQEKLDQIVESGKIPPSLLAKLGFDPDSKPSLEELKQRIGTSCLCPEEIVPVRFGLAADEIKKLENDWNITAELPLMNIIEKHAEISHNILEKEGFSVVAQIVKDHHHKNANSVSIESLYISSDMADILHLADVEQALTSARSYKEAFRPLEVIKTLVEHAQQKRMGKEISYLWVKDEFENLKNKVQFNNFDLTEKRNLKIIEDFLRKFESGEYQNDLDGWVESRLDKQKIRA